MAVTSLLSDALLSPQPRAVPPLGQPGTLFTDVCPASQPAGTQDTNAANTYKLLGLFPSPFT